MKFSFYFFFAIIASICISCENKHVSKTTYIGGEIVNPKENYVIISKNNSILDTLLLDIHHRFGYTFPENAQGLYKIIHPPESQIFYIEKGDSLMLRLNTMEFDESLVYTADASVENNFLMEMYLLNEKNNNLIFSYYKITPENFKRKVDSIRSYRKERLYKLNKEYDFSENFVKLASKSIDYEYYDLCERYAFLINKYFKGFQDKKTQENFLSYRKNVNFNDEQLQDYYIYQRFLDNYLKNRSIDYCISKNASRGCYSLNDVNNIERRLIIIDSLFTLKNLRLQFLNRFSRNGIIYSENEQEIDSILKNLQQFGLPKESWSAIQQLAELQRTYFIGKNISQKKLFDSNLNPIVLQQIIKKPTIVFSWSIYSPAIHKPQHEKMNQLRNRYPEINFIGINIDDREAQLWINTLENFDYNQNYEYQLRGTKKTKPLYRNYLNKIMFINKQGEIVFGNIQLEDPNFENYIVAFLNQ